MNVYINPIANGIGISLMLIYLAFFPILIHQYRKYGTVKVRGNIVKASFVVYMITAWFMTIMPLPSIEEVAAMKTIQPNLRPFLFAQTFFNHSGFILGDPRTWIKGICHSAFYTVAFNVVLTIPLGVFLRKYFKLSLGKVATLGLLVSFFYEMTQYTGLYGIYPKAYRFADVDDLIVNTFGAVLGYFLANGMGRFLPNPEQDQVKITEKASLVRRALAFIIDSVICTMLFETVRAGICVVMPEVKVDFLLFLMSEMIVFIVIPLLRKRKQTIGCFVMKLSFKNKKGEVAKTRNILMHNVFIVGWLHFSQGLQYVNSLYLLEGIFQIVCVVFWLLFVVKSLAQKNICYFWESWSQAYIEVITKS